MANASHSTAERQGPDRDRQTIADFDAARLTLLDVKRILRSEVKKEALLGVYRLDDAPVGTRDVAEEMNMPCNSAGPALGYLADDGLLDQQGSHRKRYLYELTHRGREAAEFLDQHTSIEPREGGDASGW